MRTEEILLTQIVSREIRCPCDEACIAKPPAQALPHVIGSGPPTYVQPETKHETFDQYILCVTRFTKNFIKDRVMELRSRAEKNLHIPLETWRLFDESAHDRWFTGAVKKVKLHFADTKTELEKLLGRNLFSICEMALEKAKIDA